MENITTNILLAAVTAFLTFWGLIDKFFIKPKIELLELTIEQNKKHGEERCSNVETFCQNTISNLQTLIEEKIKKIENEDKIHYEKNVVQLNQLQKSLDNVDSTMKDMTALLATNTAFLRILQDNLNISIGESSNVIKK